MAGYIFILYKIALTVIFISGVHEKSKAVFTLTTDQSGSRLKTERWAIIPPPALSIDQVDLVLQGLYLFFLKILLRPRVNQRLLRQMSVELIFVRDKKARRHLTNSGVY